MIFEYPGILCVWLIADLAEILSQRDRKKLQLVEIDLPNTLNPKDDLEQCGLLCSKRRQRQPGCLIGIRNLKNDKCMTG